MAKKKGEEPAKPRLGRPPSKAGPMRHILGLKGRPHYKQWLQDFANDAGMSMAALIYFGLSLAAKKLKFRQPPEEKDEK